MRWLGLRPGDRVILAVGNGPLFPAALAAVLANGGSPLLLHVETPPAELKRTAMRYGVRFMVCDGLQEADLRPAVRSTAPLLADTWGSATWGTVDQADPAFDGNWKVLPGVPLHPTSGTTGRPKLAVRPGRVAVADAMHFIQRPGHRRPRRPAGRRSDEPHVYVWAVRDGAAGHRRHVSSRCGVFRRSWFTRRPANTT